MQIKILPFFFVFLSFLSSTLVRAQEKIPIIPLPQNARKHVGTFNLSKATVIFTDSQSAGSTIWYFKNEVLKHTGISLSSSNLQQQSTIRFTIVPAKKMNGYSYAVSMTDKKIEITAVDGDGLFMGAVSLLQLIRLEPTASQIKLPMWNIEDKPQYQWRGFMLDESRHFFGIDKIKQLLDWMAFYKLNRFHWHLTDEPAWRIEIKRYPLLTLIGGTGNFFDEFTPAQYYTQEQIKEIVTYAAERHIVIIPEIDMPGHATAANRAYPQYSGGGNDKHPEFTFHPGKESTYQYLSNILKEVNVLFPSGMIHLGGDEVTFGNQQWSTFPEVKSLMQKEGLANLKQVERYFIKRMSDTLTSVNTKTLAWDEVADFNLRKDSTIVFWWRHDKPEQLETCLKNGYQVVICPRLPLYFDFVQDTSHNYGRKWSGGQFNAIESIYRFALPSIDAKKSKQVLGMQANLWTETVENSNRMDYLIFPRISALAEASWNEPESRIDFNAFEERLKKHLPLYQQDGIYYYDPFAPNKFPEPVKTKDKKLRFKTED